MRFRNECAKIIYHQHAGIHSGRNNIFSYHPKIIEQLVQNLRRTIGGLGVVSILVVWTFRHQLSAGLLATWSVVQCGLLFCRYRDVRTLEKLVQNRNSDTEIRPTTLLILMVASAIWWNVILIGGACYAPPSYDFFSIIVVLGIMTGAILSLSAVIHIYLIFSFLLFTPQLIFFSQLGGEMRITIMLLGLVYIPYMYSLSKASYNNLLTTIKSSERLLDSVDELHTISVTDPLTGIHNRRYFFAIAQNLIDLSVREKCHISVLMLDIDYFKKVNDTHGHQAGDQILIDLTAAITPIVRKSDVFARMGGEEFSILLYDASKENGLKIAEKICKTIEKTSFTYNEVTIPITVSIGVASKASDHDTLEQLLKTADRNLYTAKHSGRNCYIA